jgi:uncharacterized paraquat-inducible protein A
MLTFSDISRHRYGVIYLTVGLLVCLIVSWMLLVPKGPAGTDYKFMHCRTCKTERAYDGKDPEAKCTKCKRTVIFVPTVQSIHNPGPSRWKSFLVAAAIEAIVYMGLLVYLINPGANVEAVKYLYCNCPKCKWRLRFRETSAGKSGQCPRCRQVFEFPDLDYADTRECPAFDRAAREGWPEELPK